MLGRRNAEEKENIMNPDYYLMDPDPSAIEIPVNGNMALGIVLIVHNAPEDKILYFRRTFPGDVLTLGDALKADIIGNLNKVEEFVVETRKWLSEHVNPDTD